jgi:aminoglycoside phosphotransferase family enzyme/predicted kinase
MAASSTVQVNPSWERYGDPAVLAALAQPAMYGGRPSVAVHETHASWVFVAGDHAYKVKKRVALDFLDYSTLALRRSACREEVRVNQELAADIYLGVRAIVKSQSGFRLTAEDAPGAVEYAVEMRSFRDQDTFSGLIAAGSLTSEHVAAAARLLAGFHRAAAVVGDSDPDRMLAVWRRNIDELQRLEHPADWRLDVAGSFGEAFVNAHEADLRQRESLGLVRDGHGDLRCEHVLSGPTVRVVDRIEFDPELRRTDIACDLAFLAMDLEAHGQRWAASELYSAYRRTGLSLGDAALCSFYAAHWALVRAKVALITAAGHEREMRGEDRRAAQRLWSLSERLRWRARTPLAVVVCGPAASGKSMLAGELSRCSELPVVSSDAVRKRLASLGPFDPARPEHYSARFTRATYEQLARDALLALRRHDGVIVDATCRSRRDRAPLLDALRGVGVTPLIVRCEVPLELARERAAQRLHDPRRISDATPQIAEEQFHAFEELDELPAGSVLRLDTAQPVDAQIVEVSRTLDRRWLGSAARSTSSPACMRSEQP